MKAADVMTAHVISIAPEDSILKCVRLLLEFRISGLPVVDAKVSLVGVVTEGDFLRRTEAGTERKRPRWLEFITGPGRLADEHVRSHGRKVAEVMTPDPIAVVEDTPVEEIVRLMEQRRIKRLPVLRADKVVGIVAENAPGVREVKKSYCLDRADLRRGSLPAGGGSGAEERGIGRRRGQRLWC